MNFLSSKTAVLAAGPSAVRLPQPTSSAPGLLVVSPSPKGPRAALASPSEQHQRHRADRSRYQAQCRRAMSF